VSQNVRQPLHQIRPAIVPPLILKTPTVQQRTRKPNSFAATRSASRDCMLTFNPFKMILSNDKLAKAK